MENVISCCAELCFLYFIAIAVKIDFEGRKSRDLRVLHQNSDIFFDDLEQSSPKKFNISLSFYQVLVSFVAVFINYDKLLCFFLNIFL